MDISLRHFQNLHYSAGELSNVKRFVRESGKTIILPYDQFIEHDNRHMDPNPEAANPDYIMKLAIESGCNAVVFHYGVAKRFWTKYAGEMPLILKVNGKTSIPSQDNAFSVHTSFVDDAVKIGASGIGYTMFYGSPAQDRDLPQLANVRRECESAELPLIVWAYPRGSAIETKGGKESSYAIESAVRMAVEMGATIVKANLPVAAQPEFLENQNVPSYYRKVEKELLSLSPKEQKWERAKRVVAAAQGIPVLFSGGSEIGDEDLIENANACIDANTFGFIFGRNVWKRPKNEAVKMVEKFQELLDKSVK